MDYKLAKDAFSVLGYVTVFASLTTMFALIFSVVFVKVLSFMLPYIL